MNEADMNYYNLKEKNLIIQGCKITVIMMSLIITISSIIFIVYMTLTTYYKNSFHFPWEFLL